MSGTEVILTQWDEQYAPPEQDVLRVAMVGTQVFLDVCRCDETTEATTYTRVAGASVSAHALLAAIATCKAADVDRDRREPAAAS